MCVKNCGATVKEAVESVIHQDYPHGDMELLIVDGFSSDDTLSVIEESISGTGIKMSVFQEKEGLGSARQIVVDNAHGEYIVWIDGDMILSKRFISDQVEYMHRNRNVGIAKGKYWIHNKNGAESLVETLENTEFILHTMFEGETSSKSLGTSGCIYRTKAILQAGGFDPKIKGVGEDMDAERRVRNAGWSIHVTPAVFYETRRKTWASLWREYFWHGYGGYYLFRKDKDFIDYYKFFPPAAIVIELCRASTAYKLFNRKRVFLLPLHYIFKRVAWVFGFLKNSKVSA